MTQITDTSKLALLACEEGFDPIEDRLRTNIRGTIEAVFDEELNGFLGRLRYGRTAGAVKGYRHGNRDRQIIGTFGTETISVPRARVEDEAGHVSEWRSKALPRYQRLTKTAEALIASVYLAGTNTRRVMLALWGMLAQFSYTKMVIVVDADIDARNWDDIAWALATRMDPARDVMVLDSTPMDYLDFASPRQGLAGKIGIDATTKIGAETTRDWGEVMALDPNDEAFAADLLARHLPGAR